MAFRTQKGFTLIEILLVIVILAAIVAFAIPNYQKSIERAHLRDAITQLRAVHAAQEIFRSTSANDRYFPSNNSTVGIIPINNNLGLNLIANDMTYTCTGIGGGTSYQCDAVRNTPAPQFTVRVTNAPLSATNPSCVAGACP